MFDIQKIFEKIKKVFLPTNPIPKSKVTGNKHIFFFGLIMDLVWMEHAKITDHFSLSDRLETLYIASMSLADAYIDRTRKGIIDARGLGVVKQL
jgi:hypothetical protein